jgi:tRNA pseudouridine38-40 synthase
MPRYFVHLAYNGARYHGWQVQENASSVQQVITQAIELIWKVKINLVGCGRTDTGVHAKDFYAHYELDEVKSQDELDEMTFRLNRYLPDDIVIYRIFPVPDYLHARFSAISRTYKYYVHTRKDPFLNDVSWFVHSPCDVNVMNEGAALLLGTMDYTSFSKLHSSAKTNICTVKKAEWERVDQQLTFTITADRFLRNMVRAIVGTLMELGQGKISLEDLRKIVEGKDRSLAGESVPAKGLFLTEVRYPGI